MDFELDDTHKTIQQTARALARDHVAPNATAWDRDERFPQEIIPTLGELGFLGICVSEDYGGAGLDTLAYAIVVEEISRADGSLGLTVASHNGLGTSHIANFGSEEQKRKYLPKLASGEWLGAWALTEPGSGSDSAGLLTRAEKVGDAWRLNGTKIFVTQGSVGGVCVVLAATDPALKHRGITAFAIDRGTPGATASRKLEKMGMRSSDTVELSLVDVEVDDAQRVGRVGSGFIDAMQVLDKGRISIGALALGLGEGALAAAIEYAKDRRAFGHAIADYQAIQWMIADSRTELDAARLLLWRAASLADRGQPFGREAAMAKLFASEAAQRACDRSLQIHGGYGYTREFPVERHLRDVRLCRIGEGTSEIQRLVISRDLLRG